MFLTMINRSGHIWGVIFCSFFLSAVLYLPYIFAAVDLSQIKQVLADKSYANYWDRLTAISKLKSENSLEAALILGALFDDDEAPIREAAVMALGAFKDKETGDYLAKTALVNPKSKRQRFYAAWSLGLIKDNDALSALIKALNNEPDEEVRARIIVSISCLPDSFKAEESLIKRISDISSLVRAASIKALGGFGSGNAYIQILKRSYDANKTVKIAALESLARIKPQESAGYLESALKDPAFEVRAAALETLVKYKVDDAVILKNARELLRDKNLVVCAAAAEALKSVKKPDALRLLAERLPGAVGRLRYDIIVAMRDLTGHDFGFDCKSWLNWYQANNDRLEMIFADAEKRNVPISGKKTIFSGETIPNFFNIPILGLNIVFIIDFSGSMKYSSGGDEDKGDRKIDQALNELEKTLKALPAVAKFNVIILSTEATRCGKGKAARSMLQANESNKKLALDFTMSLWDRLEDIKRGRGDHYDALLEALSEPEVDTVFLLSDGKPTYGTYMHPDNIIENIYDANRFKKAVINTVTIGKKGTNRILMKKLAEISNGVYAEK